MTEIERTAGEQALKEGQEYQRIEVIFARITTVTRLDTAGRITTALTRGVEPRIYVDVVDGDRRECVWEGLSSEFAMATAVALSEAFKLEVFDLRHEIRGTVQ